MSKFLLLAFRNVFRNRRRTLMTLLMVGGGVVGLLLVGGYFAFMTQGLRESTIQDGLGHIQIFTADHFRRDEVHVLDTGIGNWRQVVAKVSTGGHVHGVVPRIEFYGMVSNGQKSAVYLGNAVDPVAEQSLGFHQHLDAGRDLKATPGGEVEAIVGAGLAKSMNVKVGDGLFMLEATILGVLGASGGVIVSNLLGVAINAAGLHMPPPPGYTVAISFHVLHLPGLMVGSSILVIVSLAAASSCPRSHIATTNCGGSGPCLERFQ